MTGDGNSAADNTLTKDLPGLPIEFRNLRIDETGFRPPGRRLGVAAKRQHPRAIHFRPEAHFAWEQVTAVRPGLLSVSIEGFREPGDRVRTLVRAWTWGPRARLKRATEAWKEYQLRTLERDGVLRGTTDSPLDRIACRVLLGAGILIMAVVLCVLVIRRYHAPVWEQPHGWGLRTMTAREDAQFESLRRTYLTAPILVAAQGTLALAMAFLVRRMTRNWRRWKFSRTGFVFSRGVEGERCAPSEQVRMGFCLDLGLAIGQSRVNRILRREPVAWPVFRALNEASGKRIRFRTIVDLALMLGWFGWIWGLMFWAAQPVLRWEPAYVYSLVAVGLLMLTTAVVVPLSLPCLAKRTLAAGREMLRRLGW